jgi:hypothetical protein
MSLPTIKGVSPLWSGIVVANSRVTAYFDPKSESRNERAERLKAAATAATTDGTAEDGVASNNAADVPA